MKKRIVPIIACFVALIAITISVSTTIAWLVNYAYIGPTEYQILQIDSTINLYKGLDVQGNYNAAPDMIEEYGLTDSSSSSTDSSSSSTITTGYYLKDDCTDYTTDTLTNLSNWEAYSTIYYNEKYAFQLMEKKFMLSETSSANTFSTIKISNLAPSRIFTYKFEIVNYAKAGTLAFAFKAEKTLTNLENIQVRMWIVDRDDKTLKLLNTTDGDKTAWKDFTTDGVTLASGITLGEWAANATDNKIDLWLQVRMKPEAETTITSTSAVTLPAFVTTLEVQDSK